MNPMKAPEVLAGPALVLACLVSGECDAQSTNERKFEVLVLPAGTHGPGASAALRLGGHYQARTGAEHARRCAHRAERRGAGAAEHDRLERLPSMAIESGDSQVHLQARGRCESAGMSLVSFKQNSFNARR